MTLLGLSALIGSVIAVGLSILVTLKGKPQLIFKSLVVGYCISALIFLVTYMSYGMNTTSLKHWDDFQTITLTDVQTGGLFGDRYEFHVTYPNDKIYRVVLSYENEGTFQREDISLYIKDYWGELVYSRWGSHVNHDFWLKAKSIFVDKFTKEELKKVEKSEKPITKNIK